MLELQTDHPWLYHCFTEQGFHTICRSNCFWAGIWTDLIIEHIMIRSIKSRVGGLTRGRGVTETVRLQWIYSMHKGAGVHDAMTSMTNVKHKTSEQHMELGTRSNRYFTDLHNIQEWLNQPEPFDLNEPRLRSLSSGLTASDGDGVNCYKTEVGAHIQKKLDNMNGIEASIKRSDQVFTSFVSRNPG